MITSLCPRKFPVKQPTAPANRQVLLFHAPQTARSSIRFMHGAAGHLHYQRTAYAPYLLTQTRWVHQREKKPSPVAQLHTAKACNESSTTLLPRSFDWTSNAAAECTNTERAAGKRSSTQSAYAYEQDLLANWQTPMLETECSEPHFRAQYTPCNLPLDSSMKTVCSTADQNQEEQKSSFDWPSPHLKAHRARKV